MPILSFSSNDIDVITGKKTRTIRKAWKTPLKVGDRLYCYWNLVSKEKNCRNPLYFRKKSRFFEKNY